MAFLILKNLPVCDVQLDVKVWEKRGGFRGFQNILDGYHIVRLIGPDQSILSEVQLFLPDILSVRVLVYNDDTEALEPMLVKDSKQYKKLALSGAMTRALYNVLEDSTSATRWRLATSKLRKRLSTSRPIPFKQSERGSQSRFVELVDNTTNGTEELLAVMQASFVQLLMWDVPGAAAQFVDLLQAHYHAGEEQIIGHADYFGQFSASLGAMFYLEPSLLHPESSAIYALNHFIEDLGDGLGSTNEPQLRWGRYVDILKECLSTSQQEGAVE